MRLDEYPARLVSPAGAPRDLLDLLKAALGRAEVAAGQAEVGVHHSDQGQVGEVIALGDQLGADDDFDGVRLHPGDEIGSAGGRPDGVGRDDRGPRLGEERRDFVGDALDAGTAGDEAVLLAALRAGLRRRHYMPAVMAGEPRHQPVLDHPGGAVGALEAVPAMPTEGEWSEASPVEEQERLLAAVEIGFQLGNEARGEPAPTERRILRQIDGADLGHARAGEAMA